MSLDVGIAFHESVPVKNMEEVRKSEKHRLFGEETFVRCNCGARYTVFLYDKRNPENGINKVDLEREISKDCNEGKHPNTKDEIRMRKTP